MPNGKFTIDWSKIQVPQEQPQTSWWDKLNVPIAKLSPEMQKAIEDEAQHSFSGKVGKHLVGTALGLTSPASLGLGAVTGGAGLLEKVGLGEAAPLIHGVMKAGAAGMAGHGAYNAASGVAQGDADKAIGGVIEGGLGLMGLRSGGGPPKEGFPEFKGPKGAEAAYEYLRGQKGTVDPASPEYGKWRAAHNAVDNWTLHNRNRGVSNEIYGEGRPEERSSNAKVVQGRPMTLQEVAAWQKSMEDQYPGVKYPAPKADTFKGLRVASRPLSIVDAEAEHAKALAADEKAGAQTQKAENDKAAANVLVMEQQAKEAAAGRKRTESSINEGFKVNEQNNKPLQQALDKNERAQGQAIEEDKRREAQAARTQDQQNKRQTAEVARDQQNLADVQDWLQKKREADAKAKDAATQQQTLDDLKKRLTEVREPSTIRETIRGKGENGGTESATILRTEPKPPEGEDGEGGGDAGGGGTPKSNSPAPTGGGPAFGKPLRNKAAAVKAQHAVGGPSVASFGVNPQDGFYRLYPAGEQPPWAKAAAAPETAPTEAAAPEAAGAATDAIQRNTAGSFSKLSQKEQDALTPHLVDAMNNGYNGDIEELGNHLADRLNFIKEGRAEAQGHYLDDAMTTLRRYVKKNGPMFTRGNAGEVKAFKDFMKQNGVNTNGLFSDKAGVGIDRLGEDLKDTLGFENNKETAVLEHLKNLVNNRKPTNTPVEELTSKIAGQNWWEPKVSAEVQDYTGGDVPTVDVPPPTTQTGTQPTLTDALPEGDPRKGKVFPESETTEPEGDVDVSFNPADLETQQPTASDKVTKLAEAATPDLVNEDPLAPMGKPLTPEGVGTPPPHPGRGVIPVQQQMTPEQFAQEFNKAAPNYQVAEAPFTLTSQQGPAAPDTTGDLFGGQEPPPAPMPAPLKPQPKGPAGSAGADLFSEPAPNEEGPFSTVPEPPSEAAAQPPEVPQDEFGNRLPAEIAKKKAEIESGQPPVAQSGAFPMRLFKSPLDAAGQGYGDIKQALASGEAVPPEGRAVAGRAAQRLNKEFKATQGVQNSFDAVQGAKEALASPDIPEGVKARLRAALDKLGVKVFPPDEGGGTTLSALGAGQGRAIRRALGNTSVPEVGDTLSAINMARRSTLLSPYSAQKKLFGDMSGLIVAGLENPSKAGDILSGLFHPETFEDFKSGYSAPTQGNEERSGIESFFGQPWNPLGVAGRTMSGLTEGTKGVLDRAGFSPDEQKDYTMTSTPGGEPHLLSKYGTGWLYRNLSEPLPSHFIPFTRVPLNILDWGYEASPLGAADALADKALGGERYTPEQFSKAMKRAAIGTGVTAATAALAPKGFAKQHPYIANGVIMTGPMGIPMRTGMALKDAYKPGDVTGTLANAIPDIAKGFAKEVPGVRELSGISEATRGNFKPFGSDYIGSYTNFLGYPNRTLFDPQERQTSGKDLSPFDQWFGKAEANIPGVSTHLPAKKPKNTFNIDWAKVKF